MSLFRRLKSGLTRSSQKLSQNIGSIFTGKRISADMLAELEEALISADLGLSASAEIIETLGKQKLNAELSEEELRQNLAMIIADRLAPLSQPLDISDTQPFVILMTGVNGAGKTTTIGKLAQKYLAEGKSVLLAAGDTFRAAAIEQLQIWGQRANVPVMTTKAGGDAAGLAFDALTQAKANQTDILIIDTAGRLQSNDNLMAELEKIIRVLQKIDASAPHASLLVLDATTGQNAISRAEIFQNQQQRPGLLGPSLMAQRGGVLVAIADKLALPIHFIGVGEQAEDLQVFDAHQFAQALIGLDEPIDQTPEQGSA